ncbi:MAG: hypothetical protein HYY84_04180 [Deltaproteobacteria bacterium]|nr:hypothetical protein [Deltaproteobacteria bacterium]
MAAGTLVVSVSEKARATSLDALKPYCKDATNDNQLIQCGTANIRSQCQRLIGEIGRHEGATSAATQNLGKAFFHADKCVKRSDVYTGNYSWLEALTNLGMAQAAFSSAKSAGIKPRVARHDEGVEDWADDTVPLHKDPAQQLKAMKVFCDSLRAKLAGVVKHAKYAGLIPEHRALVDQARATASKRLDQCDNAIKQKWADAVGMANEAAAAVATAYRALISKERKDHQAAVDDAEQRKKPIDDNVKRLRSALQAVFEQINALRAEAARCELGGNQAQLNEKETCQFEEARSNDPELRVQRAMREQACIANEIPIANRTLVDERASYNDAALTKKIVCKGLVSAVIDKACAAFPLGCEIVRDGQACYNAAKAAGSDAVKVFARVSRFVAIPLSLSLDGLKRLFEDATRAYEEIKTAASECWQYFKQSVAKVGDRIAEWFCKPGSLGGVVCDRIRAGKACFTKVKAGLKKIPAAAAARIWRLSPLEYVDPFSVGEALYDSFKSPELADALGECEKWAKETVKSVAVHYCEKNESCRALLQALATEGITPENWRSRAVDIARIAMRMAFQKKGSVTATLSAGFAVTKIYKFLGLKGEGSLAVTVTHAGGDSYNVKFAAGGAGAVTASIGDEKDRGQGGIALGLSGEGSRTFKINAADRGDWRLLLMLGTDAGLQAAARSLLGPLAEIKLMRDVVASVEKHLFGSAVDAEAIIAKLGRESGCKVCGFVEGEIKGKLESAGISLGGGAKAQLCMSGVYRRDDKGETEVEFTVSTGVEVGGAIGLTEKMEKQMTEGIDSVAKRALGSASGAVAKIGAWFAKHAANAKLDLLNVKASLGGSFGKTIKGLKVPKGQLADCVKLATDFLKNWAKPVGVPSQSWSVGLTIGKKSSLGVSISMSAGEMTKPKSAVDLALLQFGPLGTFAIFLKNGDPGSVVTWTVTVTKGKLFGKEFGQGGGKVAIGASVARSYVQGSGSWSLGELKSGSLGGALALIADVVDGKCAPKDDGTGACDRAGAAATRAPATEKGREGDGGAVEGDKTAPGAATTNGRKTQATPKPKAAPRLNVGPAPKSAATGGTASASADAKKIVREIVFAADYVKAVGTFQLKAADLKVLKDAAAACGERSQVAVEEAVAKLQCYIDAIDVARVAAETHRFNSSVIKGVLKRLRAVLGSN